MNLSDTASKKFQVCLQKALEAGVCPSEVTQHSFRLFNEDSPEIHKRPRSKCCTISSFVTIISVLLSAFLLLVYSDTFNCFRRLCYDLYFELLDLKLLETQCLIDKLALFYYFRPPVSCGFCNKVDNVTRLSNLSPDLFHDQFAYSGRPIIVEDATLTWSAMEAFNFSFFKSLYSPDSLDEHEYKTRCQFFPYNSEFLTLAEFFQADQALLADPESAPWYIGW